MKKQHDAQSGIDPVIAAYMKGIDRSLLRENLKLTVQQRFEKFEQVMKTVYELQAAGKKFRSSTK